MSTTLQLKRKLIDFLNVMKSVKESSFTHTSITSPAGAFYITYNDINTFHTLYKSAMKNDCDLFLTEKHRDISPVLIDFDFRFNIDVTERRYTIDMIKEIVLKYINKISEYVDIPEIIDVYVLEKTQPVQDDKKNITKDGIHIIIPNIVTRPSVQMLVRTNLLKTFEKIFKPLKTENKIEDIFDEQVIWKNNWQMYGSKKPNSEAYRVTYNWGINDNKIFEIKDILEDHTEYVEILSIRNKYEENTLKKEHIDSVREIDIELKTSQEEKEKKQNLYKKIIQNHENNFQPTCDDLVIVKQLISILKDTRANSYGDWIRLGWCLRNISIDLLQEWDEFSKKSTKYEAGYCDSLWYKMREGGLGIGTLHMWAKQDNPEEYAKLVSEDISSFIRRSMSQTDYDIALVIARMFKHRFIFYKK